VHQALLAFFCGISAWHTCVLYSRCLRLNASSVSQMQSAYTRSLCVRKDAHDISICWSLRTKWKAHKESTWSSRPASSELFISTSCCYTKMTVDRNANFQRRLCALIPLHSQLNAIYQSQRRYVLVYGWCSNLQLKSRTTVQSKRHVLRDNLVASVQSPCTETQFK
jgi:hypothetical protein